MKDLEAMLQHAAEKWHTDVNGTVAESERFALAHIRRRTLVTRVGLSAGLVGAVILGLAVYNRPSDAVKPAAATSLQISAPSHSIHEEKREPHVPVSSRHEDKRATAPTREQTRVAAKNTSDTIDQVDIDTKAGGFDAEYLRISSIIAALSPQEHVSLLREHRGVARLCVRWSKSDLAEKHLRLALAAAYAIGDPAVVESVNVQLQSLRH